MAVELSAAQQQIVQQIIDWFYSPENKPYLSLGGYAGTGKTTLVAHLSQQLREKQPKLKIAFGCYTGKAARVLQEKLNATNSIMKGDAVGTLHSLIYDPLLDDKGHIIAWERKENTKKFDYGLIVVDEASMLAEDIWKDLLSYHIPILAVGDHGQLPPIDSKFNLMQTPDLKLEQIYRQAEDNPIIQLSQLAREEGQIPFGKFSSHVRKMARSEMDTQEFLGDLLAQYDERMLVLVGYNHTRVKINKAVRQLLEFDTEVPQRHDRVICLRNDRKLKIYNGMLGFLENVEQLEDKSGKYYKAEVYFDGDDKLTAMDLSVEQFNQLQTIKDERRKGIQLFDFGYVLTVHKAQGSQAERVVVFEERFPQMDDDSWRRWLYTAVTRSSKELYIVA
jgi:exodeoxyribonuclease-5